MQKKVCVMGLGYIGFPTACAMASAGHQVVGVDVNSELVVKLSRGEVHITNEEGLSELATSVIRAGALRFSTKPEPADVFVICVPTPLTDNPNGSNSGKRSASSLHDDATVNMPQRRADLSYIMAATKSILPYIRRGNLVILESTVPPGTTEHVLLPILESAGFDRTEVHVAHAPERVLPGALVRELRANDRVIGGVTEEAARMARELYSTFVDGDILSTDATTAEMAKLMENTFRDVNIALANEFAIICDKLSINVEEAIELANRHPRVNILSPGPGVGGHCIPVDPYFIIERVPDYSPLLQVARKVNRGMPRYVARLVNQMSEEYGISRIVILGAAYKPDVGDFRESPAFEIKDELSRRGYVVELHDPFREDLNRPLEEVCADADLLVVATDHAAYKQLSPASVAPYLSQKLLLDTRLSMPAEEWEQAGFVVWRLGDGRHRRTESLTINNRSL